MRRLILPLAVVVAIIAAAVVYLTSHREGTRDTSPPSDPKEKGERSTLTLSDFKERGELLYRARYYKVLIATHERVLKAAPGNEDAKKKLARIYYELGKVEQELGDKSEAERNMTKAAELDPELR